MIQQSIPRHKAAPRTAADLQQDLERYRALLLEAQRGRNQAQAGMPSLRAAGDATAIEERRKEIARLDAMIVRFTEQRTETEAAIELVKDRERFAHSAQVYGTIRRQAAAFKTDVFRLADSIEALGKALISVLEQQDAMEATMRSAGVEPDRFVIRNKLKGLLDMNLYLASDGKLGQIHSMYSPEELRRSGQASLKRAANEAHELFLRQARDRLGINDDPPEAA